MTSIEEIYNKLTSIDIAQQKLLWDERGRGYYGEFLVFSVIYPHLRGNCKILMNINIPTLNGKTTEIDLLLIHESGLYVFEMKHYKGTIYGKPHEPNWTQYFRTAPNQHFRNPVAQNQYHIDALKKIVPDIPVHSYIVFTSSECDLRVDCNDPSVTICELFDLHNQLRDIASQPSVLSMEQINHLFCSLLSYSPISQSIIDVDGKELPFHEFISNICSAYIAKEKQLDATYAERKQQLDISYVKQKQHLENTYIKQKKKADRVFIISSITSIITATLIALACIVISFVVCISYQTYSQNQIATAQQELASFAQKFERVQDYTGEITISKNLVTPANVVLEVSPDIENAVQFSCTLIWNGSNYGASIGEDAVIIVVLNDGTIKEYPVYNDHFPYLYDYHLGKSTSIWYSARTEGALSPHDFYGISISDIAYIKLSNIDIWVNNNSQPKIIASGYEIELYSAE